jgi:serine/threonine protein kinase
VFLQVLGAVAYAHHRLVLHRDLKPDNILVTATGTAKLLDFGVAQFLNDEGSGLNDDGSGSGGHTVRAGMTPEYASPEQLNGAPLTVESDVYSKRGLGLALANQQEFGPAVEKVRHALATFEKLDAADRSDGGSQQDIGVTRSVLGVIALRMGNRPQAEIDLNESVRVLRETLSEHPADVSVRQDLSEAYVALASVRSNSNTCGESATPLAPAETLWRDLARTTPLAAPYAGTQVATLERSHPACRQ